MDKRVKPVKELDAIDGTIYGKSNIAKMVNPYKSYFIVHYYDGTILKGNNLYDTGWHNVKNGIKILQYKLSTGHLITIPKFQGYLPTIEVSESIEGFKLFHAINVNCVAHNKIMKYKIILKEDNISKYNIGDIIVSEGKGSLRNSPYLRMSGN
jgi:hypothetical protein